MNLSPFCGRYVADATSECSKIIQATRRLMYARRRCDDEEQELPTARVTYRTRRRVVTSVMKRRPCDCYNYQLLLHHFNELHFSRSAYGSCGSSGYRRTSEQQVSLTVTVELHSV